jgi:hypothetical protein
MPDRHLEDDKRLVEPSEFAQSLISGRHIASLATQCVDGSIHLTAVFHPRLSIDYLSFFSL